MDIRIHNLYNLEQNINIYLYKQKTLRHTHSDTCSWYFRSSINLNITVIFIQTLYYLVTMNILLMTHSAISNIKHSYCTTCVKHLIRSG